MHPRRRRVCVGSRLLSYGPGSFLARPPELAAEIRAATPPGSTGRYYLEDATCGYSGSESGATLIDRLCDAHHWWPRQGPTDDPLRPRRRRHARIHASRKKRQDSVTVGRSQEGRARVCPCACLALQSMSTAEKVSRLYVPSPDLCPAPLSPPTSRALSARSRYTHWAPRGLTCARRVLEGKESAPGFRRQCNGI